MPPLDEPPYPWRKARNLLAIRLDNLGDVVMLGPALRTLKTALPDSRLTLLASPHGSRIAPMLPWVDQVMVHKPVWQDLSGAIPQSQERELALVDTLRKQRFDAAFIFTSFTQTPWPPAYVCHLAGIPVRIGQSKEFGGSLLSQWIKPPADSGHQVDRNLHLLEEAGFDLAGQWLELTIPTNDQRSAEQLLAADGIDPYEPFIALSPGASCPTRRYPPERFAAAARSLSARTGMPVVIIGSKQEAGLADAVLNADTNSTVRPGSMISLAGRTSVTEMAAVIRRCRLLVSNHTGPMHIADALARPMVILFSGSEYESQWRPRRAPARLLRRPTACSPCYRFTCPFGMECLDISPETVVAAALEVLTATLKKTEQRVCYETT